MDLFDDKDWGEILKPLIEKYRNHRHPLHYGNIYQLLVMVILSAQDRDDHINSLAPAIFDRYPTIDTLTEANQNDLTQLLQGVRYHNNKIEWILQTAKIIKSKGYIPENMKELTTLPGIGRKSANVLLREMGRPSEGVLVDLHVLRVAPRLGITKATVADTIEKDLMKHVPKNLWEDTGLSLSFLGREICRPTNPKHNECILADSCEWFKSVVKS
ncbi:endonuclease III domain-containing protein [Flavobacterium sp. RNTU_13]|uniref:endonuclease III domain-containing protein n=1 Tax=Flavobacterium sp. RNTU_13 TaxID=3375145 RepID=UPI0039865E98